MAYEEDETGDPTPAYSPLDDPYYYKKVLARYSGGTEPGPLSKAWEGVKAVAGPPLEAFGKVVGAPKSALDALARTSARAQGLNVPDTMTMGQMVRESFYPTNPEHGGLLDYEYKPENPLTPGAIAAMAAKAVPGAAVLPQERGIPRAVAGEVGQFGAEMLTDPITYLMPGVGGINAAHKLDAIRRAKIAEQVLQEAPDIAKYAPKLAGWAEEAKAALPGVLSGADRPIATAAEKTLHRGFQAQMGLGAVEGAAEAKKKLAEGDTEGAVQALTQAGLSAGMVLAPPILSQLRRGEQARALAKVKPAEAKPSLEPTEALPTLPPETAPPALDLAEAVPAYATERPPQPPPREVGPGFYSQLRTVVDDPKTPNAARAEDWARITTEKRILKKKDKVTGEVTPYENMEEVVTGVLGKPGVKPAELQDTGLMDWLKERAGQKVTKKQIQDYLDQNEVRVEEVVKSDRFKYSGRSPDDLLAEAGREERIAQQWQRNGDESQAQRHFAAAEELNRAAEGLDVESGSTSGMPKFSNPDWQVPGGKNYRELLLTLPDKTKREGIDINAPGSANEMVRRERAAGTFTAGHYAEPNVLAHVRFNERTDADGKKVLFIEEIQSDWGEKGRKEGFNDPEASRRLYKAIPAEDEPGSWYVYGPGNGETAEVFYGKRRASTPEDAISQEIKQNGVPTTGHPRGPFVTSTPAWTDLAVKRITKWAADHGFDRIAWTPGAVQSERYNLGKYVDSIRWYRDGDGTFRVQGEKDGNVVLSKKGVEPKELPNTVGKDLTDKILTASQNEQTGAFSGLDLQVGGEGMKAYYDEMVPQSFGRLAKKEGGQVGQTYLKPEGEAALLSNDDAAKAVAIGAEPVQSFDIPPTLKGKLQPLYKTEPGAEGIQPTDPAVTRKRLADLYPDNTYIKELPDGTYDIALPGDRGRVVFRPSVDKIEFNREAFRKGYGREPVPGETPVGVTFALPHAALVEILQGADPRVALHEHWHVIKNLGNLTAEQEAKLQTLYPTEEAQADAFANWMQQAKPKHTIFTKLWDSLKLLGEFITGKREFLSGEKKTEYVTPEEAAGEVFRQAQEGALGERTPGTPAAGEPKYAVAPRDENFRRWFGQSKVVDESGQPKTVYHGSSSPEFTKFDPNRQDVDALYGPGFYFTENPEVAGGKLGKDSHWTYHDTEEGAKNQPGRRSFWWRDDTSGKWIANVEEPFIENIGYSEKGARLKWGPREFEGAADAIVHSDSWKKILDPGYLSKTEREQAERLIDGVRQGRTSYLDILKDQPYNIPVERIIQKAGYGAEGGVIPAKLAIQNPFDLDAPVPPKLIRAVDASGLDVTVDKSGHPAFTNGSDLYDQLVRGFGTKSDVNDWLQANGFDGITHIGGGITGTNPHRVWVAFSPEQIKSATGNRGTFDPTNPDIRYAVAPVMAPEGAAPALIGEESLKTLQPASGFQLPGEGPIRRSTGNPPRVETRVSNLQSAINEQREQGIPVRDVLLDRDTVQTWKSLDPAIREKIVDWSEKGDDAIFRAAKDHPLNTTESAALDSIVRGRNVAKEAARLDYQAAKGTPEEGAAWNTYMSSLASYGPLEMLAVRDGTGLGRAMAIRSRLMEAARTPDRAFLRQVIREIPNVTEKDSQQLLAMFENGDPHLAEALRSYMTGGWKKFWALFRANLIGIPSEFANITGNTFVQGIEIADKAAAAGADWFLRKIKPGSRKERYLGEAGADFSGMIHALPKALADFANERMVQIYRRAITGEARKIAPGTPLEYQVSPFRNKELGVPGLGRVARLLTTPLDALGAGDDAFQAIIYPGELAARSYRLAAQRLQKARGPEVDAEAQRILSDIFKSPDKYADLIKSARDATARRVYRDKPWESVSALQNFASRHQWLNAVIPFVKTPANILRYTIRHSPAGFLTPEMTKAFRDFKEGRISQGDFADQLAPRITGTLIAGAFAGLAKAGFLTGAGPKDPADRAALLRTGWQPYSIVLTADNGSKVYVPFSRFDPLSQSLGVAADVAEMKDAKDINDAMSRGIGIVISNLSNRTYMRGLADFASAYQDPQRYMQTYIANLSNALTPSVLDKTAQAIDPYYRETKPLGQGGQGWTGLPSRILNTVESQVPGLSQRLPVRYGPTGEPSVRPGGEGVAGAVSRFLLPSIPTTSVPGTELEGELARLGLAPSTPRPYLTINGKKVFVRPQDREVLSRADEQAASELRWKLPGLRHLPDTIEEGGNRSKQYIIEQTFAKHRSAARQMLLRSASFRSYAREQLRKESEA